MGGHPDRNRGSLARRIAFALLLAASLWPGTASAGDVVVRVESPSAAIRAGPGGHHRLVARARHGEVLPVVDRDAWSRWFLVRLEDGSSGWILGDEVTALELAADDGLWAAVGRFLGSFLARGAYPERAFEATLLGGASELPDGLAGTVGLRLAYLLDGRAGLELGVLEAPLPQGSLLLATAGAVVQIAPGKHVVPYGTVGGGAAFGRPAADAPLQVASERPVAYAGAGVKIAVRPAVTVRLEARQDLVLDPDGILAAPGGLAGLSLYF